MKKIIFFVISIALFTSCYTTKTNIGEYKQLSRTMESYEYDQARQFYLLSGLIPLGHPQPRIPDEPCMIRVKSKFVDYLLSVVTFGITSSRTVEVFALKGGSAYPMNNNQTAPSMANSSYSDNSNHERTNENAVHGKDIPNYSAQENNLSPQRIPQHDAEAVQTPTNPSDARVSFENQNFKVGEKVFYRMRDKMYSATIMSFKGSEIAVVRMENGAMAERYLKDLVKAK